MRTMIATTTTVMMIFQKLLSSLAAKKKTPKNIANNKLKISASVIHNIVIYLCLCLTVINRYVSKVKLDNTVIKYDQQKEIKYVQGSIVFTAGIRNEMHALTEESFHFN